MESEKKSEKKEDIKDDTKEEHHKPEHHSEHHKHDKKILKKIGLQDIFIGVVIILGIALALNILLTFNINKELKKDAELAKESLKPAKIELILLKNSKCNDCYDIAAITQNIKNLNLNITKERALEFDSKEGKEAIAKHKIEKIPAIIVTGEIEKASIQGLEKKENALVLTKLAPPYTNAATGRIEGRVILYHLKDAECAKCNELKVFISQIKGAGIKISEEKSISANSDEGRELIKKYNIGFVPTIILSKDAAEYSIISQAWLQVGSKETDGSYVLRVVNPPFINLTTGQLRGIVEITYLTDKSCKECYNVSLHESILTSPQSFAMKLDEQKTIDIGEDKGKELAAKYNITQVPTVILSSEANAYPLSRILKQFFSIEKDGSYVFRKAPLVGTYRDLETNEVIEVEQDEQG